MNLPLQAANEWLRFSLAAAEEYLRTGLICLPPSWSVSRRADPYLFYARLRERSPVHRSSLAGGVVISRSEDIRRILQDERISSDSSLSLQWQRNPPVHPLHAVRALILEEGDDHQRHRSILARILSSIGHELVQLVRIRFSECASRILPGQPIEIMEDFVFPAIREITCDVLGIPPELRPGSFATLKYGLAFAFHDGDRLVRFPRVMKYDTKSAPALRLELNRLLEKAFALADQHPGVGVISALSREVYQNTLSRKEAFMLTKGVLSALFEPLSFAVGNAILLAATLPDVFSLVSPDRVSGIARETLRFESAVQAIVRYAREDLLLQGKLIRKGENIVLLLGSANRDPAEFDQADVFDPMRNPKTGFSFGFGSHSCLGASVAQMVVETALSELRNRFESIKTLERPTWRSQLPMRGLGPLRTEFSV